MSKLIAITGANSAVGRALLRLAAELRIPCVACVRSPRAASELPQAAESIRVAYVDYTRSDTLLGAFEGAHAVIHLPGVLIERPRSTYEDANVTPARALVGAARRAGARKLVLVSAIGADPDSTNRYYASKGRAEAYVRESGLEWTILRAPLVLGAGTEGEQALLSQLRKRHVRLLAGGRVRQQPLDADDLARGALKSTPIGVADQRALELVGPETLPYAQLVERAARIAGRTVRIGAMPIPLPVLRALLELRTRLLGPGFSPDALDVILDEHVVDPKPALEALGIELTPLDATLRSMLTRETNA